MIFSNDAKIDMRFVCPRDVKKMLVQRVRSMYWKKWAAKHEHEELKGIEQRRLYQCPAWYEVRREIPRAIREWEQ